MYHSGFHITKYILKENSHITKYGKGKGKLLPKIEEISGEKSHTNTQKHILV